MGASYVYIVCGKTIGQGEAWGNIDENPFALGINQHRKVDDFTMQIRNFKGELGYIGPVGDISIDFIAGTITSRILDNNGCKEVYDLMHSVQDCQKFGRVQDQIITKDKSNA